VAISEKTHSANHTCTPPSAGDGEARAILQPGPRTVPKEKGNTNERTMSTKKGRDDKAPVVHRGEKQTPQAKCWRATEAITTAPRVRVPETIADSAKESTKTRTQAKTRNKERKEYGTPTREPTHRQ